MLEINFPGRTFTVHTSGGAATTVPLPAGTFEFDTNIERLSVSDDLDEVVVGLPGGQDAHVELRGNTLSVDELRGGVELSEAAEKELKKKINQKSGLTDRQRDAGRAYRYARPRLFEQ